MDILCIELKELRLLYVLIYIFCVLVFPIEYESFLNRSIYFKDGTLTDTTTPGQNGPESNNSKGLLHSPQSSRTEVSPSNIGHLALFGGRYYLSAEDTVRVDRNL